MLMQLMKISYGLCIPHSCSSDNLRNISQHAENTLKLPIRTDIYDYNCRNEEKAILPFYEDKYIISFFCAYTALLLISTCYDMMIHHSTKGDDNILVAFSVLRNGKQLFSSPDIADNRLGALNGLKVIQMLWIILGHRYIFNALSGITNFVYLQEWKQNLTTSILQSATYAVDTFLVLSGLLLSYFFLKHMDGNKNRQFPVLKMYLYRYLRLAPSLLAMILFYISIFKILGDGPDWVQIAGRFSVACTRTWWATALFFNNYLDQSFSCVEHSWYLAVDTQLFLFSPILLMNLNKRPWKTCLACVVICVCSGIYTYIITIQHNLGALLFEANKEYLVRIYYPTPARMPPWFIGIIFGFLIHSYGNVKLSMVNKCLAWTFTLLLLCIPIYVQLFLNRADEYSAVNAAFCNSCTRQLWGIGIGIFSYLCTSGNGGIINEFLSLPIFQILVRFSYSMYLTHVPVMAYFIGEKRHPEYFATMKVAHQVMGDIPFIFLASTIWTLAFESPFRVIGKLLNKKEITSEKIENQLNGTNHSREKIKKDTRKVKVISVYRTDDCKKIH
ncbi:unnamed protein product [Phaedon cochleariae]|uniref:Acyltransferase 3 domain-containing protein n=1 Tax=Phaedon cochleariae TaxID=80249 RepID=A0A9P0GSR8_PHACE|nr:unnamed protein product [Phaedon cochleariae]